MKKRYWLINYRKRKGLSQSNVATEIGVSQQMYNYIENNKRNPSTKLAKKIADVLNFSWTKFYEDQEGGETVEEKVDSLFYKQLGEQLNTKRQMLGYSFRYLSKLTGISAMQLDDYMNGKNRIKKDTYKLICEALHIKPHINLNVDIGIEKSPINEA